jgi:hypothetical protein
MLQNLKTRKITAKIGQSPAINFGMVRPDAVPSLIAVDGGARTKQ